jgi:hypothetical protein
MAYFIRDAVVQYYSVRVVRSKDSKERIYANIGFLSSSKIQGTDEYASDEPLYVSALVKGQAAQKVVDSSESKSLLTITAKVYSYNVATKDNKKESRVAWEILTAAPFIPKSKQQQDEPHVQPEPDADAPF